MRAVRGMAIGLAMSAVNLAGVFITILGFGGLDAWSGAQFVGLFGLIEVATGAAFIITPNIWHLPVAEAELGPGRRVTFAASTILIPHWAGGAKALPGLGMIGWAGWHEGVGPATPALGLIVVAVCAASVGLSMALARLGAAHPGLDVLQVVVKRPGHPEHSLPAISIGASVVQVLLSILTLPAVKSLPPTVLYRPELSPSAGLTAWSLAAGGLLFTLGFLAWWGRLVREAPRAQEREAERFVNAS